MRNFSVPTRRPPMKMPNVPESTSCPCAGGFLSLPFPGNAARLTISKGNANLTAARAPFCKLPHDFVSDLLRAAALGVDVNICLHIDRLAEAEQLAKLVLMAR